MAHPSVLHGTRAVLFDLDGTLLDSFQSHYRVYQHVFADLRTGFGEGTFMHSYPPNWSRLYERIGLSRDRWPAADQLWLHYYEQETPGPRDGAAQALAAVKASRRALGLVTSGERARVERDLERLGWQRLFDAVVCGGDTSHMKPNPAPLRLALGHLHASPTSAGYVGDNYGDGQQGKAAGTSNVALSGGVSATESLPSDATDVLR